MSSWTRLLSALQINAKKSEIKEVFQKYDSNDDGIIKVEELAAMFQSLGQNLTRRQLMEIIHEVDYDESGGIELEEFYCMHIKLNKLWPRPELIDYRDYFLDVKIRHIRRVFDQCDPEGTGFIDEGDIESVLETLKVPKPKEDFCEAVLKQAIPDGSGRIDFDRTCAVAAVLSHARRRINYREFLTVKEVDNYRKIFNENDGNHDDKLTKDELDSVLRRLGYVLKRAQLQRLIEDFDEDENGEIDFEEFCVMICRMCRKRRLRKIDPEATSCRDLYIEEHFTVKELLLCGYKLPDLRKAGVSAREIYSQGISALEFRRAGYASAELRRAGVTLSELRSCGYSLADLRLAGFSDGAVSEVNRKLRSTISVGNLGLLPQCNPSYVRTVYPKDTLSNLPLRHPLRQMTPMIREHTDWNVIPPVPATHAQRLQVLQAAGASIVGTSGLSSELVDEDNIVP
jgi:Ca2+-binding EF-hand superfamily protein